MAIETSDARRRSRRVWGFGVFALATAALAAGLFQTHVAKHRREALTLWDARLTASAEDRSLAIGAYIKDRLSDATFLASFPSTREVLAANASGKSAPPKGEGGQPHLEAIFAQYVAEQKGAGVYLFNPEGALVTQAPGSPALDETCFTSARMFLQAKRFHHVEFHRSGSERPHLAVQVAVLPEGADRLGSSEAPGVSLGAVVILLDPEGWLYPFMRRQRLPTRTGEALLCAREGKDLVFLSPLRFGNQPPFGFRVPFETPQLAGRAALMGLETFAEFTDYRGEWVFAATRNIPNTGWGLVSKVDRSEALRDFHREILGDGAIAALALLGLWGAVLGFLVWKSRGEARAEARAQLEHREALEAKQVEILQLNRLLRTLSEVNQMLVRETDRGRLLSEACRILVDHGQFRMAWVGLKEKATGRVIPTAWAGHEEGFLSEIGPRFDDAPEGRGVLGQVIREGRAAVNPDLASDPELMPWIEKAVARGYRASAAVPLRVAGETAGCIAVYSAEPHSFPAPLVNLLEELAGDLGYALDAMEARERRAEAERARGESEGRYRLLFENLVEGFAYCQMIWDEGGHPSDFVYLEVNAAFGTLTGLKEVTGRRVSEVIPGIRDSDPALFEIYGRVARTGTPERFEMYVAALDMWFLLSVYCPERDHFVAVFDVITERKRAEEALRESERRLREVQELAGLGSWSWDVKTGEVKWSEEVFRIFGLDPKTFTPNIHSILDLSPWPEDHARDQELIRRAVESHEKGEYEQRFLRPDGSVGYYFSTFQGLYDSGGALVSIMGSVLDITARKRAENALTASEKNYRELVQYANSAILRWRVDGAVTFFNEYAEALFGYGAEEILGRHVGVLVPGSDSSGTDLSSLVRDIAENPDLYVSTVNENLCRSGRRVWMAWSNTAIRNERGEVVEILAVGSDVTAQKRAEEALRHSEETFRTLFEKMGQGVVYQGRDGVILSANPAALEILGLSQEQIQGRTSIDPRWRAVREDGSPLPGAEHPAMEALATGKTVSGVVMGIFNPVQDSMRWIRVTAVPEFKPGEQDPYRTFSTFEDITEMRRVEEAAREHRELLNTVVESITDPMYIKDLDGRYLLFNTAAARVTGKTPEEVLGKDDTFLFPPEEARVVMEGDRRVMESGTIVTYEERVTGAGGVPYHFLSTKGPRLDAGGRIIGLWGIAKDVTELKRSERMHALAAEVLRILNDPQALPDATKKILDAIARETGFDAVGIRLREGDDFPYAVASGFASEFISAESSLLARGPGGEFCLNGEGKLSLECTCGLVLSGKADPESPLFSPGGSAWTNDARSFLEVPVEQDPRLRPRNRCIHEGYQSVALIPIRAENQVIGLLQLNDRRKDRFTPETVRFFEGIAGSFGVALLRMRDEEALRQRLELQDQLAKIASSVPGAIFSFRLSPDGKTTIPFSTPAIEEFFGFSPDALETDFSQALSRLNPEDSGHVWDSIQESARSLNSWSDTFRVNHPRRGEIWLEGHSVPRREEDGAILWHGYVQEVTDRKRAEAALAASEERYRLLSENSADVIWLLDLATLRFAYVSPSVERLRGYTPEEVMAQPLEEALTNESRARVLEALSEGLARYRAGDETARVNFMEVDQPRKDGTVVPTEVVTTLLTDAGGTPVSLLGVTRDVTERKRAEEALRESEAKYRSILETMQDAYFRADMAGILTMVSPSAARMYGYASVEEMIGMTAASLYASAGQRDDILRQLREAGRAADNIGEGLRKDGSTFWVSLSAQVVRDGEGIATGTEAVVRDVTERVEAERALRESEAKYRTTLDSMLEGCQMVGRDWRYLYVNRAAAEHGRRPAEELLGRTMMEAYPGIESSELFTLLQRAMEGETVRHQENRFAYPDGRSAWFDLSIQPVPEGLFILSVDITERKWAEDELRASEERFSKMFHSGPLPIALSRLVDGVLMDVNGAWETLTGLARDEVLGRVPTDLGLWTDPSARDRMIQEMRERQAGTKIEMQMRQRSGGIRDVLLSADFITLAGEKVILTVAVDITERKRAEDELARYRGRLEDLVQERTVELAAANRELESFSYSVSHDLRAPVRAMDGFARILEEEQGDRLDDEGRRLLRVIQENSRRMGALVDDLLRLSRVGRQEMETAEVDMAAVAQSALADSSLEPERRGEVEVGPLPKVQGDAGLLHQVWVNLLSNAVKFTRKAERPRIEVGGEIRGGEAVYWVRDNGVGFDMRYSDKLFGVFQRLHAQEDFSGTGVGLALVHRVIQRHGGRIWAESEVGRGATFTFALPVRGEGV